jgi:hypothetical protein
VAAYAAGRVNIAHEPVSSGPGARHRVLANGVDIGWTRAAGNRWTAYYPDRGHHHLPGTHPTPVAAALAVAAHQLGSVLA